MSGERSGGIPPAVASRRLAGKTAIVTGGAKGIGRGICRRLAAEGAAVTVVDIDDEVGQATAGSLAALGGPGRYVHCDVSRRAEIEALVEGTVADGGRLDVLVNNAVALSPNVVLEDKTDEMMERVLGAALWATWWTMKAAFPVMKAQGGGRIINFTSIDAEAGAWLHADYNAAKQAIKGLSRAAAVEWGRFNVLVNVIAPTAAGTEFQRLADASPGFAEASAARKPLGRVGDPERDIGPAVAFLASDDARYITGEVLHVDGGQHLPRYNSAPSMFARAIGS